MAKFKITTEDGTFMVTADSADEAMAAIEQSTKNNYVGKTDDKGVPEGMVFDPATNRMVDTTTITEKTFPGGSWIADTVRGVPFVGEYADEAIGWLASKDDPINHPNESQQIKTEMIRQSQKRYAEENPMTSLVSRTAASLTALPAAMALAPAALPGSLAARTALGATVGATTGGVEGFVSGYGEGEGDDRLDKAKTRGAWGAGTGGVIGAAMPAVTDALSAGARNLLDRFTVNKTLKNMNISRPAADEVKYTMQADDALGPTGQAKLAAAGDDAMLADAGETAAGLLDTTIQKSGPAGRIATQAVEKRAAEAGTKLRGTMDVVLGRPPGIDEAARKISERTAAARRAAYDAAYSKPIDYASPAGREIENVFSRTPSDYLSAAIKKANNKMKIEGLTNRQIIADIAEDGTITFRQMPNMIQVDYLKRALNDVAEDSKNIRGAMSGEGADASKLAKQLRDAAVKAVPEYKAALKLGGDTIEEKNALELGYSLLSKSVTRENVKDAVDGITDAERKQLALGLRQHVDDMMANVDKALKDTNMDAREAAKVLRDMSSKSSREKLTLALGEQRAKPLFAQLEKAEAAIRLKAEVVTNSRTFGRTETNKRISERGKDSVSRAAMEGRPLELPRRAWQKFTGANPEADAARESKIYEDISKLLTGPRGQDAQDILQRLTDAYRVGDMNEETARKVGRILAGTTALPTYQFAMQPK